MEPARSLAALMRFHWAGGVRLSLRAMVPMAALGAAGIGMQAEPSAALAGLSRAVSGPGLDPFVAVCELALVSVVTSWARPRLAPRPGSWIRHLPASGSIHRLALVFGLAAVQAPLLLFVALAAVASGLSGGSVGLVRIGSLLLIVLAVAWAAAPRDPRAGGRAKRAWSGDGGAGATIGRISARALGWRRLGPLVYALIPAAASLILLSNNHLDDQAAARVGRFCSGLSVSFVIAGLAEQLGWRRPAWPWARSLPWSSTRRIAADAWFLGAHALPLLVVATAIDWRGAVAGLVITPFLAVRGAGLIRSALATRAGASGRLMTEGFVISGLIFLWSWCSWLVLAATPWALRAASASEREQRVTRWHELRHLPEGDTGTWSGR